MLALLVDANVTGARVGVIALTIAGATAGHGLVDALVSGKVAAILRAQILIATVLVDQAAVRLQRVLAKPVKEVAAIDGAGVVVVTELVGFVTIDRRRIVNASAVLAGIRGIDVAVIAVHGREAALLGEEQMLAGVVRQADIVGAVATVVTIQVRLTAIGQIEVGAVATLVVDADINVAQVVVHALGIFVAAERDLAEVAGTGGISHQDQALVIGARFVVIAIAIDGTAIVDGRVGTGVGHTEVFGTGFAIVETGEATAGLALTVGRIGHMNTQVALAIIDGGRVAVVPDSPCATIRMRGAAIFFALFLGVDTGVEVGVAGVNGARVGVIAF